VYVADFNNHLIRHISPAGVVSTLAAIGAPGFVNGMSATAKFNNPRGVAVDTAGNVYVADFTNHVIRKISTAGVVSTFAGVGGVNGSLDGSSGTAKFNNCSGVAVDSGGNVYVADYNNHLIRKISPVGVVSTFAGVGGANGSLDGTSGTAKFYNPSGVAVDTGGNVYVADYNNHLIRKISPAGVVSTLAGVASQLGFVDGASGTAKFYNPYGVSVDSSGNVYVADQLNHRIRMINLAGVVSTVAGAGYVGTRGADNGTGGTAAFNYPTGVAVDNSNNLYVADNLSNQIRKITPIY
jgi:sugar lactone lactonase YvrE